MESVMELLAIAMFLAVVGNRLTEALIVPIFDRLKIDKFWLLYVSWVVSGAIVAVSGVNLFPVSIMPDPIAGRILTIIIAGGGSNFLADIFSAVSASKRVSVAQIAAIHAKINSAPIIDRMAVQRPGPRG